MQFGMHNHTALRGIFVEVLITALPDGQRVILKRADDQGQMVDCFGVVVRTDWAVILCFVYETPGTANEGSKQIGPANGRLAADGRCEC